MGIGGQRHAPSNLPVGNTQYTLYRRLDRPPNRPGRVREMSAPPGYYGNQGNVQLNVECKKNSEMRACNSSYGDQQKKR